MPKSSKPLSFKKAIHYILSKRPTSDNPLHVTGCICESYLSKLLKHLASTKETLSDGCMYATIKLGCMKESCIRVSEGYDDEEVSFFERQAAVARLKLDKLAALLAPVVRLFDTVTFGDGFSLEARAEAVVSAMLPVAGLKFAVNNDFLQVGADEEGVDFCVACAIKDIEAVAERFPQRMCVISTQKSGMHTGLSVYADNSD
jgi:hypothetical protein